MYTNTFQFIKSAIVCANVLPDIACKTLFGNAVAEGAKADTRDVKCFQVSLLFTVSCSYYRSLLDSSKLKLQKKNTISCAEILNLGYNVGKNRFY